MRIFVGARLFDGERFRDDCALVTEGEAIRALVPHGERPVGETVDLGGGMLAPGFVDWQVNGGGGYLFNDAPTPRTIHAIVAAHRRFGTTALAPTLITDAPEKLAAALDAGRAANPGSLGVHVEGPFIDSRRKGAHPLRHIRAMTEDDARVLIEKRARVVTLAPASVSLALMRRLAEAGIVVSLGHSEATAEQARACFDAGARAVTHLFNAMSPLGTREPGVVGAALADGRIYAGFIADGLHVHELSGQLAYRLKGARRLTLVSDAMPPAAGGPDVYDLSGRQVRRAGLSLTLPDGTLAGAVITLHDAVRFAAQRLAPLADALKMATSTPARLLRVADRHGVLKPGARADLVHLADDLALRGVWFGGEAVEG
ncbi:MAG TPA: N-acetylglucosamine-6-phosphate deacetylase [Roseiarcus sp.]|nr:N-acetylglucosamine-6-phosphate deacetylase [Roseiarcus sp.]